MQVNTLLDKIDLRIVNIEDCQHVHSVDMSCEHSCGSFGEPVAHPPEGHEEHTHGE